MASNYEKTRQLLVIAPNVDPMDAQYRFAAVVDSGLHECPRCAIASSAKGVIGLFPAYGQFHRRPSVDHQVDVIIGGRGLVILGVDVEASEALTAGVSGSGIIGIVGSSLATACESGVVGQIISANLGN